MYVLKMFVQKKVKNTQSCGRLKIMFAKKKYYCDVKNLKLTNKSNENKFNSIK